MRRFKNKRAVTYRRREKTEHRAAGNAANVGFSLKSSESQHLFCEIRAKDKINNSRKQNRAFSGCARGWFLTIPCRALLASASAPPPYSRKSRCAAIFREYLVLYNNQMRTRICKNFCFRRKGEAARFCNMRAPKSSRGEENSDCTEQSEGNGVVLKITTFCFDSSKQKV